MKTIAFFNNKGGVGKTSLVYHLAWMYERLDLRVVAADFDPQANLTSMFLEEDQLEQLWPDGPHPRTVFGAVEPLLRGTGDIQCPHVVPVKDNVGLVAGDLGLSRFEDKLSDAWPRCHNKDEAAFRCTSSLYRILWEAAEAQRADVILIDVGPNLGAINRAAILAAQHVVIPLAPDLYSLQGLRNLGPTLRDWRDQWIDMLKKRPEGLRLPGGEMQPAGYVLLQHSVRLDRPAHAYGRWAARVPETYRKHVLNQDEALPESVEKDPYCLSMLKHYRSLMPLAMEARKPIFHLLPADGAIGAHMEAVRNCAKDFQALARRIAEHCGITLPNLSVRTR